MYKMFKFNVLYYSVVKKIFSGEIVFKNVKDCWNFEGRFHNLKEIFRLK